ncbi:unnamed protein product [Caenorhabditis sp. 36 PRJEB53466]|nr:unnamed protein product [Caenorhabditis sp. 36 PRJEB53466]
MEDGLDPNTPLMSLRQIKACGHLLLGTLQLRCEKHGTDEDPRQEMVAARVFVKKRLKELAETDDKTNRNYVLRALYTILDKKWAVIFNKIGQVSGELAFLSTIYHTADFPDVELQFIWTCDYLFSSGQMDAEWRGDFEVPSLEEYEMPLVNDLPEEEQERFAVESEKELRRQLENYLAIEDNAQTH